LTGHNDTANPDIALRGRPPMSMDQGVMQLQDMPGFGPVPEASGSALYRHPGEGRLFGLSYDVRPEGDTFWFRVKIEAWTYGVQADSLALPIMSFIFQPDGSGGPLHCRVGDLKIMSRPLADDTHTGARALSVALFFINQINAGQVPNCEKILKLHGLYPSAKAGQKQPPADNSFKVRGD
jgi:hypothetical protein